MTRKFSDLGIKAESNHFTGDKIKISKILNREITVMAYAIKPSSYKGNCLHLQIAIGDKKHVVFTGSTVLMDTIQKVDEKDLPFQTVIVEENDHYEFT